MLKSFAISHSGRVRTHNEDVFAVDDAQGLYVVCDGMGGAEAGEVAAAIARDSVMTFCQDAASLEPAIQHAHRDILQGVSDGKGAAGMGTTLVAACFTGHKFLVAWVGDSRAYVWSPAKGSLKRLSRDHSQVEWLLAQGLISPAQAHRHPQKNVITQALGQRELERLEVGVVEGELRSGETLLLCSDGLSDELEDIRIAEAMAASPGLEPAARHLVDQALAAGGRDNVTVLLVERPRTVNTTLAVWLCVGGALMAMALVAWLKHLM